MHRFDRWRDVLQAAHNEAELRHAMADYVSCIGAAIAALPQQAQAAMKEEDVQSAAVTLLMVEMRHDSSEEVASLLHEIAHTYAAAAVRLTKLRREPLTPAE